MAAGGRRVAVVDLGTNSTRLLVADLRDGAVTEVDRRTEVTRLGEGVDSEGRLSASAIERVLSAADTFVDAIDALGAERVVAVATSAVRDAANAADLLDALRERLGVPVTTISGAEEARLTFLGATAGRRAERPLLVIDIGGGSTEYVVGPAGTAPSFHVSTQLGSVRQTERHLRGDPPRPQELDALRRETAELIAASVPGGIRAEVEAAVAVAGTPTSLAAIDQRLDPYDSARVHGHRLERAAVERMLAELARLPLDRRRDMTGLHPDRAPTIVAGAAILAESMLAFELGSVEVSETDLLHGAALDPPG